MLLKFKIIRMIDCQVKEPLKSGDVSNVSVSTVLPLFLSLSLSLELELVMMMVDASKLV